MNHEPEARASGLRILFLNDVGYQGGAGLVHQRLAAVLAGAGHEVTALGITRRSTPYCAAASERVLTAVRARRPDLVVVGNLHGAGMDATLLIRLAGELPCLLVANDIWPVSGRCAYPGDCTKYLSGCDARCPTPHEYPVLAPGRVAAAWQQRQQLWSEPTPPVVACYSEWSASLLRRAMPPASRVHVGQIRLPVPLDTFRPLDRSGCRRQLELPEERLVVLFSATSLDDPRKGLPLLRGALAQLADPRILPVAVGSGVADLPGVRSMGSVQDPQRMAMLFAAADLFVGPSQEEVLGQVFLEAAACGTPSVGLPVGGVPEAIAHQVSGLVAAEASADSLAECMAQLIRKPQQREAMRRSARRWATEEWSGEACHRSLLQLFRNSGLAARLPGLVKPRPSRPEQPPDMAWLQEPGSVVRMGRLLWWGLGNGIWLWHRSLRAGHGAVGRMCRLALRSLRR